MKTNVRSLAAVALLCVAVSSTAVSTGPSATAPAPAFSLPARGGGQVALADLRGQVVLINFWATWCGPCRKEMPLLEQISKKYQPLGFRMVAINVEEDGQLFDVFLREVPVTFPILLDPANGVSKLYKVSAMPSTVIVDRKGKIRYVHQGYKPGDESKYQDVIRSLIRERA
jgi:thiol-disulfide isomerase/thioredoxin